MCVHLAPFSDLTGTRLNILILDTSSRRICLDRRYGLDHERNGGLSFAQTVVEPGHTIVLS